MIGPDFVGGVWRKSRASTDGESCVEIAQIGERIFVRDSKSNDRRVTLMFDKQAWREFIINAKGFRSSLSN